MSAKFVRAGALAELNAKGRLVVRGSHRPILVVTDQGRICAFDNRCPHMGFPLDRGSVEFHGGNVRPGVEEPECHGPAEAPPSAGDDRDFSVENFGRLCSHRFLPPNV